MDKTQKAYQELIIGIKNYVKKCIDDYQADKTYTGIVVATGTRLGYKIRLNGVVYDNVPTIGGTCTTNESVKLLIPNGSFSNMFILKGGVDIKDLDTQIQYVTTLTPDSDIIKNIFSNEILSDETILATLQHNIISTDSIRDAVADINDLTDDDAIIQNIYSNSILTDSTILNRLRTNILNSYYLVPFLTNLGFLTPSSQTITDLQDTDTSLGNRLTIAEGNITTLSTNKVDMTYLATNYITNTEIANTYATIAMLNTEKSRLDNLLSIAITTNNLVTNVANINTLVATDPIVGNLKNLILTASNIQALQSEIGYLTADSQIITDLQDDINNKIWQEDIDNALSAVLGGGFNLLPNSKTLKDYMVQYRLLYNNNMLMYNSKWLYIGSKINEVTTVNPYGENTLCGHLNALYNYTSLVFSETLEGTYTLVLYMKANESKTISVNGETATIGTNWSRVAFQFTVSSGGEIVMELPQGEYYFYEAMLVMGTNIPIAWQPSLAEVQDEIEDIYEAYQNVESELDDFRDEMEETYQPLSGMSNYVTQTEFTNYQNDISTYQTTINGQINALQSLEIGVANLLKHSEDLIDTNYYLD